MGKLRKPPSLLDPNRRAKEGVLSFAEGASLGLSASRRLRNGYKGPLVRVRRSYDNTELDIGYKYDSILEELVLNEEDLTTFVGHNLLTQSEFPNGVTDAPSRSGLLSATTFTGFDGGIAFGYDGTTSSWAYKTIYNYPVLGINYTISVFVEMDDGLAPVFGGNAFSPLNDFALTVGSNVFVPDTVDHISGSLYRVSVTRPVSVSVSAPNTGVTKYATNSNRTFKVTGYQLVAGSEPLPYQKTEANPYGGGYVTTLYDQSGNGFNATQTTAASQPAIVLGGIVQRINNRPAPKFDGVDDWLVTPSIDLTGTDKVNVYTVVRKLSDADVTAAVEFSADINSGAVNGAFGIFAPPAVGGSFGFRVKGTTASNYAVTGYLSPISAVLSLRGEISSDLTTGSVNGFVHPPVSTELGSGNMGNHPLYIGSRGGAYLRFNGHLSEIILYPNLDHAGTTAIDLNMMAHFNIS